MCRTVVRCYKVAGSGFCFVFGAALTSESKDLSVSPLYALQDTPLTGILCGSEKMDDAFPKLHWVSCVEWGSLGCSSDIGLSMHRPNLSELRNIDRNTPKNTALAWVKRCFAIKQELCIFDFHCCQKQLSTLFLCTFYEFGMKFAPDDACVDLMCTMHIIVFVCERIITSYHAWMCSLQILALAVCFWDACIYGLVFRCARTDVRRTCWAQSTGWWHRWRGSATCLGLTQPCIRSLQAQSLRVLRQAVFWRCSSRCRFERCVAGPVAAK